MTSLIDDAVFLGFDASFLTAFTAISEDRAA